MGNKSGAGQSACNLNAVEDKGYIIVTLQNKKEILNVEQALTLVEELLECVSDACGTTGGEARHRRDEGRPEEFVKLLRDALVQDR